MVLGKKKEAEKLIDLFCFMRLTDEEQHLRFFEQTQSGLKPAEDVFKLKDDHVLITVNEASQSLEKFRKHTIGLYHLAMKEVERLEMRGSIPRYFIFLLLLLGFDEIIWVVKFFVEYPHLAILFVVLVVVGFILQKYLNLIRYLEQTPLKILLK